MTTAPAATFRCYNPNGNFSLPVPYKPMCCSACMFTVGGYTTKSLQQHHSGQERDDFPLSTIFTSTCLSGVWPSVLPACSPCHCAETRHFRAQEKNTKICLAIAMLSYHERDKAQFMAVVCNGQLLSHPLLQLSELNSFKTFPVSRPFFHSHFVHAQLLLNNLVAHLSRPKCMNESQVF